MEYFAMFKQGKDLVASRGLADSESVTKWPMWWNILTIFIYVCQSFSIICAVIFLYAILSNKTVRNVSYNIYLVLLVIPDMILNLSFLITFQFREKEDGTFHHDWSLVVIWSVTFYYMANFWSNFIIAHQIFDLVKKSYRRIKVKPPSIKLVYIRGSCVYLVACLTATWFTLDVPWSPFSVSPEGKTVWKSPDDGIFSKKATTALVACLLLVPTLYVIYAAVHMWSKKLLPRTGRTRVISIYFFRNLLVFFAFYYPGLILNFVKSAIPKSNVWILLWFLNRLLEILQALSTMHFARKKDDINSAIKDTLFNTTKCFRSLFNRSPLLSRDSITDEQNQSAKPSYYNSSDHEESQTNRSRNSASADAVPKWDEQDVYIYPIKRESIIGAILEKEEWDPIEKEKVSALFQKREVNYESDKSNCQVESGYDDIEMCGEYSANEGKAVPGDEMRNKASNETGKRPSLFGEEIDDSVWQMFGEDNVSRAKAGRPKRSLSLFSKLNENISASEEISDGGKKRKRRMSLFRLGEKHTKEHENDTNNTPNTQCNDSGKKTFKEEIKQALHELLQDGQQSSSSDEGPLNRDDENNISLNKRSESQNNLNPNDINHQSDPSLGGSTGFSFQPLDENMMHFDLEINELVNSIRDEFSDEKKKNTLAGDELIKSDDEDDGMEDEISKLTSASSALRDEIEEAEAPMSELGIPESLTACE